RVQPLCDIYAPKKVTHAAMELVDTPGLSRTHEGSAQKLAAIREAGCLVMVVAAYGGADAQADLQRFEEDLLIADLDVMGGRIERLREQTKKPRPNREELAQELAALEPLLPHLESGKLLRELELSPDQKRAIKSFQLFSEKPRFVLINVADDETDVAQFEKLVPDGTPMAAVSLSLQMDLARMEPEERAAFCAEMQVQGADRDEVVRRILDASGQMLFFTAGEKEVRTWMIHKGGTAVDAAGNIHTDLAKGFIRAEVMQCSDLFRLGSEREIKANGLMRQEHKEYVIRDGDILLIRHN
ncbi:MAG: DUF933 domain-containing protein, partial [Pirellulaceae bacterium]